MKQRLAYVGTLMTLILAFACSPTKSTEGESSDPASDGGGGGGGATDASGGGDTDASGTQGPLATSCSTGTLFAGNPLYDGQPNDRPAPGTGIHADPPLQWQNLVFVGNTLYTRDTGELWAVDTSAESPVENLVAGKNPAGADYSFAAGPCATARFGWIKGIAPLADGSLVVSDGLANAVLHVKDPTGPTCTVEYWAGNMTPATDLDPTAPPNAGDQDGPGASAKFSNPGPIVTDEAGNAYVYDSELGKIKKIANDADHTVSTLGGRKIDGPTAIRNMTRIGSKLYAIGDDSSQTWVLEIDTTNGAVRTVIQGGNDTFPPIDSASSLPLHGLTTDGTGLIVSGQGYVWYLTTSGQLTHIAGNGTRHIDFPTSGYDPKSSHPAKELELPGSVSAPDPAQVVGSFEFITYDKGALYVRGHGDGTAAFVERIACP